MARVLADYMLDLNALNFNNLKANATSNFQFFDNVNAVFDGRTYSDVVEVQWTLNGVSFTSDFGGTNFVVDPTTGAITGGKVTGYLETVWNGTAWVTGWAEEAFSI